MKSYKVKCPMCNTDFGITNEAYCPKCGYFYKIKTRENYKWDGLL